MFTGVKVFSATKAREREELGENVTRWLKSNADLEVVDRVVVPVERQRVPLLLADPLLPGPTAPPGTPDLVAAAPAGEHWRPAPCVLRRGVAHRIVYSLGPSMTERAPTPRSAPVTRTSDGAGRAGSMVIEAVTPELDGGRSAVKRIAGEALHVEADVFKEGHDVLAAVVWWRQVSPGGRCGTVAGRADAPARATIGGRRSVTLGPPGRVVFTVEAWPDLYRSWVSELERKVAVGRDVRERAAGGRRPAPSLRRAGACRPGHRRRAAPARRRPPRSRDRRWTALARATEARVVDAAARYPDRTLGRRTRSSARCWWSASGPGAAPGTSCFPASAAHAERHGTFRDAEALLPEVERLGFDVVYLPPIHPIGRTARKGKNNAPRAEPDDVGSPWAIGAARGRPHRGAPRAGDAGGLPALRRAAPPSMGLEVALDLAFQCSPDHPWVTEHPEWFQHRPDGTIKTAENPPKRYDDIVNFDFLGPGRGDALAGAARGGPVLGAAGGAHLPGRQSAHQAPALLGVAPARGARARPGRWSSSPRPSPGRS